jgi:hypothetical protein
VPHAQRDQSRLYPTRAIVPKHIYELIGCGAYSEALFVKLPSDRWVRMVRGGTVGASSVLRVELGAIAEGDPEASTEDIRGLRDELLDLDVLGVDEAGRKVGPPGAKGLGEATGPLIVTLSDSAVLVALAGVVRSWVSRDRGRRVTLRIGQDSLEITKASEREQARLIEAWLDRHAPQ